MEQREGFRHELKYGIGYPRYLEIRSRLRRVMRTDPHGDAAGRYASVGLDDRLHHGQADPCASGPGRPGLIHPVKAVEQPT